MKKKQSFLYRTSMIWKLALAAGLAFELAKWLGSALPYLAPMTAILWLQGATDKTLKMSLLRLLGTIVGVLLLVLIANRFGLSSLSLGIVILAYAFAVRFLKMGDAMLHQAALSALLVLVLESQLRFDGLERLRDTLVGIVAAIVVNLLVRPPDFTRQAEKAISFFSEHLHQSFLDAASWIEKGGSVDQGRELYQHVKDLLEDLSDTLEQLEEAEQNLKANPFRKRKRAVLQSSAPKLQRLRQENVHLNSMIRTLVEWTESGQMNHEDRALWAGKLRALASYLKGPGHQLFSMALPPDFEKTRYSFSLYNDVLLLLKDFS